jgi:hypothetical protein
MNRIDLFDNFVWNEGDEGNTWLGEMTSLQYLYYGNTYFEYDGIPPQISNLVNLSKFLGSPDHARIIDVMHLS